MKFSVNLKSLLARFLFINLFFFSILTLATYSYLQSIEPELVGNKKKEHSKLIKNIAYKQDNDIEDRTIDSHVKRIRKKFKKIDPKFSAIETRYGSGYRWNVS